MSSTDRNPLPSGRGELNGDLKRALKYGKCKYCQSKKFSKCRSNKASTYIEDSKGKRQYFCNLGCLLLFLDSDKAFEQITNGFIRGGLKQ